MADQIILIDTSILIDYFRKSNKDNSKLIELLRQGYKFQISAVTEYEIYAGATVDQEAFWRTLLNTIGVVFFDSKAVEIAVKVNTALKRKRKQIAIADLFIAATAISNDLPLSTLNKKHFERIDNLKLVE